MVTRIITSILGLVVFFVVLPAHINIFGIAALIITLGAVWEIESAMTKNNIVKIVGLFSSLIIFVGTINGKMMECMFIAFVLHLVLSVVVFGREKIQNVYVSGFASVVFTAFLSSLVLIKKEFNAFAVFLPFAFAWLTDTGAYFAGRFFGKHKLAPNLSPKKTVEGSMGGVLACVVFSCVYVLILNKLWDFSIFIGNNFIKMIIVSAVASIISQVGDLAASAIKRDYEIKDFGKILPGHGGIMDRFDSVIFVAPFVYCILLFMK